MLTRQPFLMFLHRSPIICLIAFGAVSAFRPTTTTPDLTPLTRSRRRNQETLVVASSKTVDSNDRPKNDLMIRAALGREPVERTPTWLFRQAGRHLPEYQAYKETTGRNFWQMLRHPEDVAECTLQPLRRYDVDAAILFSDILVVAEALGLEVTMPGGVGIQVPEPLRDGADAEERVDFTTDPSEVVLTGLGHVVESVGAVRAGMAAEGHDIPLIGFSAAPWTLLFYMVGGSSRRNTEAGTEWLRDRPEAAQKLLDRLTEVVIAYASAQIERGAHMVQIFEAMGMFISEDLFYEWAFPCLEKIGTALKERYPDVPLLVFARGACYANERLSHLPFDVVTMDGSVPRDTARAAVDGRAGLQGNYDPRELIEGTPESVKRTVTEMLEELGPQRYIANLGEGLGGKEDPALVKAFVDSVHTVSEAMIASSSSTTTAAEVEVA